MYMLGRKHFWDMLQDTVFYSCLSAYLVFFKLSSKKNTTVSKRIINSASMGFLYKTRDRYRCHSKISNRYCLCLKNWGKYQWRAEKNGLITEPSGGN
jgi:hypothetical protein